MQNLSYENEFYLHVTGNSFSYERLCTKTRFQKEVQGNLEMAHYWWWRSGVVVSVSAFQTEDWKVTLAEAGLFMSCFLRQDVVALRGTHSKFSTFYLKVNYHFYYLLTSWVYIAN